MSETILKGKINYYTYIWHTEKGACEKCQALDGLNFKNTDEIPDKPHPNCKCRIEVSEENGNKDDLCDCHNGEKAAEFLSNSKEQFDIYVKSFCKP